MHFWNPRRCTCGKSVAWCVARNKSSCTLVVGASTFNPQPFWQAPAHSSLWISILTSTTAYLYLRRAQSCVVYSPVYARLTHITQTVHTRCTRAKLRDLTAGLIALRQQWRHFSYHLLTTVRTLLFYFSLYYLLFNLINSIKLVGNSATSDNNFQFYPAINFTVI